MVLRRYTILTCVALVLAIISFVSCDELPDGVEITDIPAYYYENNYLDGRVETINKAIAEASGNCETFFWITDIHWEPDLNARHSPALIKYIASKTGINKILNGGDTGNSRIICENAISQLKNAIGSNRVYTVTGNHEIVDATRYETPFERVADELRGHNSVIVYGDGNQSYFYFDNKEEKVRYIGLSSFGLYFNGDCEEAYTTEQLTWFTSEALKVDAGWSIIVFTHSLYYVNTVEQLTVVSGAQPFIDAIDHYNGSGNIACVLMGHAHKDRRHIGETGVTYILSACDRYSPYHGDINVNRTLGTISEQHFEVVVIDKGKRLIKLFSFGANARDGYDDNPGEEVDVRVVTY